MRGGKKVKQSLASTEKVEDHNNVDAGTEELKVSNDESNVDKVGDKLSNQGVKKTESSKEKNGKRSVKNITEDDEAGDNEDGDEDENHVEELKSAYQVAREANIRRNLAELEALGLDLGPSLTSAENEKSRKKPATKSPQKRVKAPPREGTRKSRRLANQEAMPVPVEPRMVRTLDGESDDDEDEDEDRRAYLSTMERKIARLKELHEKQGSTYKNPTATYEHTWMRVRTMSDKALARRISVIEKACGEHCIVKMRMFAEVLILANKHKLAEDAEAALKRLNSLITKA
mmetsp:Transcript_8398/g.16714  ORF Transcript_8398/g.16714 Transcript_8398/m.16714 type:complete len:288 (+) Transcript_8398:239-1102(+)